MKVLNVMVVGSGGREHALAWKIRQSPLCRKLYIAPGNAGTAKIGTNVAIKAEEIEELLHHAKDHAIDLVVVGPEAPLCAGIADRFEGYGPKVFGPMAVGAILEGSKARAKEFMDKNGIPTARFVVVQHASPEEVERIVMDYFGGPPWFFKADKLAGGKGAKSVLTREEIQPIYTELVVNYGRRVVIERMLKGREVSFTIITDGMTWVPMALSEDHKRLLDGDQGPNTGGMGAYSSDDILSSEEYQQIVERIVEPTLRGLKKRRIDFRGVIYFGLMLTAEGPMVLEYNVRFGDPETQVILPRMKSDLLEVLLAACEGRLDQVKLEWDPRPATCVVLASGGYPGDYEAKKEITGVDRAELVPDTFVFHAGTERDQYGKLITSDGRVLGVTPLGDTLEQSIERAYQAVGKIHFDGMHYRRDIGQKGLARTAKS